MLPRTKVALVMLAVWGVVLGAGIVVAASSTGGAYTMIHLPLYGGDMIQPTMFAGVLSFLGVLFALFGAWGWSRGVPRNGTLAILMGAAPPLMISAIVGAPLALVTVVLGFRAGLVWLEQKQLLRQ